MWTDPVWFIHLLKVWICFWSWAAWPPASSTCLSFSYLDSCSIWRMDTIILAKLNKPLASLNKHLFGESLIYLLQPTLPKMDTKVTVVGVCLRALSICWNWPTRPLPDPSYAFWQWNQLFFKGFCWKTILFLPTLFRIWLIWLDSFD